MINKGYATVIDMLTEEVHIYKFYLKEEESLELYIKSKGHSHFYVMVSSEIKLTIH